MAKRDIRDLNVEFIEDDFWPELKRQRHGSAVTALNRFSSFRQMMQFCVKKKQLPANVCYQADITPPERNEVGVRKIKKTLQSKVAAQMSLRVSLRRVVSDQLQVALTVLLRHGMISPIW